MTLLTQRPAGRDTRSPNQQLLPLTAQANACDHLEIGGCDVVDLVSRFGSPLYIVDEVTLRTACQQYQAAFQQFYPGPFQVLYASKAWSCLAICALVNQEGLGLDVVSGGELVTALQAGVDPARLYFHGNNKSADEIDLAIRAGVTLVVDNDWELEQVCQWAEHSQVRIMVRFTPGLDCHTHAYIRTGQRDSKFGFDLDALDGVFQRLAQRPAVKCVGLHAHNGSQIFALEHPQDLAGILVDWMAKGLAYGLPLTELNIGGGLGIRYTAADDPPSIANWVQTVTDGIASACQQRQLPFPKLLCEPGRSIIGPAVVTAYTVGSAKAIPGGRTYVAVDGGMSDNPRPITYQAEYEAVVANRLGAAATETVTVAGKHCESGDILIQAAHLPPTVPGDVLVVLATGAYNASMASNYNRVPRPAAVLVHEGEASLILRRETYTDLLRQDCLPSRLAP